MRLQAQLLQKTITKQLKLSYYLYFPPGYAPEGTEPWPLLFFLHGAGERGQDIKLVERHGLIRLVKEGREFPFIIAAPLCPENTTWDRNLESLDHLFQEIVQNHPVDQSRIYLTGLSMGGFGTWHWGAHQPRAFAALVPICGGTMPLLGFPDKVLLLKDTPLWVFHGEDDQVVPLRHSQELVDVLREAHSSLRFTKYEGVGHSAWQRAYAEAELIPWLLNQKNRHFCFEKNSG